MIKPILKYLITCFLLFSILINSQTNISKEYKDEKEKVIQAFFLLNNNKPEKAYQIAKNLKRTSKSQYALMNSSVILANYFNRKVAIDSAIIYAKESLRLNTEGGDSLKSRRNSIIYDLLGRNYKTKGLYRESKKWFIKGIEEAQKYNEEQHYYRNTHGLALVYYNEGNLKKAVNFFKECLEYKGDEEIVYGSYINLGMIYSELEDYKESDIFLKKAYDISLAKNNTKAIAVILLNLGENAQRQKNIEKARELYERTIEIGDKEGFHLIKTEARISVGNILMDLQDYKEAKLIYSLTLAHALEFDLLSKQLVIYEKLKRIAVKTGNYKEAFLHSSRYFEIKESINEQQKDEKINELEVRYETIKKEKEIILLKKSQELQEFNLKREKGNKKIILISFLIFLIPIIGLLINYYLRLKAQGELNKKEKEINMQKVTSLYKEKELELIKANIEGRDKERERIAEELHDSIGGNLAAIKLQLGSSKISNPEYIKKVNIQIDETYKLVRNISHSLISENNYKKAFCNAIETYLNNIGDSSDIETSFTIYPKKKIDLLSEYIKSEVFKIIQELITNTIKHANASFMDLNISLSDEKVLNILFEDNGVGFDYRNQREGLGFVNIKKRLSKIEGSLLVDSRIGRGTIINIEITSKS